MGRTAKLAASISAVLVVSVIWAAPAPSAEPGMPELYWEITGVRCPGPDGYLEVDYRMEPEWGQISYLYVIVVILGIRTTHTWSLDAIYLVAQQAGYLVRPRVIDPPHPSLIFCWIHAGL